MERKYDVFISFKNSDEKGNKTKDSALAEKCYHYLTDKGLSVFFSNIELEFIGKAQYSKVIDDALDSSRFLIAVGCSHDNLNSQWVRYEWESFLNDIRSNIKPQAEVFVLYQDVSISKLPRALRQQQAFNGNDESAFERLYNFISATLSTETAGVKQIIQPQDTADTQKKDSIAKITVPLPPIPQAAEVPPPKPINTQLPIAKTKNVRRRFVAVFAVITMFVIVAIVYIMLPNRNGGTDPPRTLENRERDRSQDRSDEQYQLFPDEEIGRLMPDNELNGSGDEGAGDYMAEQMAWLAMSFLAHMTEQTALSAIFPDIIVHEEETFLRISIPDTGGNLFSSGQATLLAGATDAIDALGYILALYSAMGHGIIVEGHTDNVPINTNHFPSNRFLSAARASALAEYWVTNWGISPGGIHAVGMGEHFPIATNDTPEGRAMNRRIDLKIFFTYATGDASRMILSGTGAFEYTNISYSDAEGLLFTFVHADLSNRAMDVLDIIGDMLVTYNVAGIRLRVVVEVHTDNIPINTLMFPGNRFLSVARASAVADYLVDHWGVDPRFIHAVGMGEVFPVTSNDTPEERALNRRIEIQIFEIQ